MIASRAIPAVVVVVEPAALGPLASARDLAPTSAFDVDDVVFNSGFDGEVGFFFTAGRGAAAGTACCFATVARVVDTGLAVVEVPGFAGDVTAFFAGGTAAAASADAVLPLSAVMTPVFALPVTTVVFAGLVFATGPTLPLPSSLVRSVDAILIAVGLVDDGPGSATCTRAAFGPGVLTTTDCCC